MKKYLLALSVLFASSCSPHMVDPGNVGVIVSLTGNEKGVHERVVGVGWYLISWNESLYLFPTFTKTYNWTKSPQEGSPTDESISFQTKEGTLISGDFGITVSLSQDKAATLFQKYRRTIDEIIDSVLRNSVRDAIVAEASKMTVEDVMSSGKITLIENAATRVRKEVGDNGINVEKISIIGNFRIPPGIEAAINMKIQATQDAIAVENQLRQTKAEAEKMVCKSKAEGDALLAKAHAEAQANKLLSESLTPVLISKLWIEKWSGDLPTYSSSNSPLPFLNVGK
jgi:regulator of protease activity HflC (stomatin/prohibitin superfamily)